MSAPAPSAQKRSIAIICATADTKSAQSLSNYVTQLGLSPALHSLAKAGADGATLEALEAARGAEYAIVLGATDANAIPPLHIGFLLGLVGRNRLCFLGKGAPPAGVDAVPRHTLDDSGLWKLLVAREMKHAGLDVDLNRAM